MRENLVAKFNEKFYEFFDEMDEAAMHGDFEKYSIYFKVLANETQGSLLFNEDPIDFIIENEDDENSKDLVKNAISLRKIQIKALEEIGLIDALNEWIETGKNYGLN